MTARVRAALEAALAWFELHRARLTPPADKSDVAIRLVQDALAAADEAEPCLVVQVDGPMLRRLLAVLVDQLAAETPDAPRRVLLYRGGRGGTPP